MFLMNKESFFSLFFSSVGVVYFLDGTWVEWLQVKSVAWGVSKILLILEDKPAQFCLTIFVEPISFGFKVWFILTR